MEIAVHVINQSGSFYKDSRVACLRARGRKFYARGNTRYTWNVERWR